MGYFQVRYDSRGVNYDRRGFIRLATALLNFNNRSLFHNLSNLFSQSRPVLVITRALKPYPGKYWNEK